MSISTTHGSPGPPPIRNRPVLKRAVVNGRAITYSASSAWHRLALIVATFVYAWAVHYGHQDYLQLWDYFGFTYRPPGWAEILLGSVLLLAGAMAMPAVLNRPSTIVLFCLYVSVYVPGIVIALGVNEDRLDRYPPILLALCAVFVLASVCSRRRNVLLDRAAGELPTTKFSYVVFVAWMGCGVILVLTYRSVMSLVSFADIYDQRAAGASTSALMGYVQTYFSHILSPALIAIGLAKRQKLWIFAGTTGCLIMYMIDAQRTVFLFPLAMVILHAVLRTRLSVLRTTALPLILLAVIVTYSTRYWEENQLAYALSANLTFRTLTFPGLTYSMYYDLFSRDGYTWWSHVKGISTFVPIPKAYSHEPQWPALGYIVAARLYGGNFNANANLFAGDGVAAAGSLGTIVIGVLLAGYLVVLDQVGRDWNRHFTMLAALPIGITLMNGQFFSAMLSFGGIFWIVALILFRPHRRQIPVAGS